MSQDNEISYKGWTCWKWTGWKGVLGKELRRGAPGVAQSECRVCGKAIQQGEMICRTVAEADRHWLCVYPENPEEQYVAQWLFKKGDTLDEMRYLFVNCPVHPESAGEYQRGDCFNVTVDRPVTDETTEEDRDRFKEEGLHKMYRLIDQMESPSTSN